MLSQRESRAVQSLPKKFADIVVQDHQTDLQKETEILLFTAARVEHIHHTILPAIKKKQWVLCDRYLDSTMAYQAYAMHYDEKNISMLHEIFCQNLMPDKTFWIDVDPQQGIKRSLGYLKNEEKFENKDISFHHRVRDGFYHLYKKNPHRIHMIDGNKPYPDVKKDIKKQLLSMINEA